MGTYWDELQAWLDSTDKNKDFFGVVGGPSGIREEFDRRLKVQTLKVMEDLIAAVKNLAEFGIPSGPPTGKKHITNIYWDPDTEEIVIETED